MVRAIFKGTGSKPILLIAHRRPPLEASAASRALVQHAQAI